MAFNTRTQSASAAADTSANWKAAGFLNFSLPTKEDGKLRKLGAIPLRAGKDAEKILNDWLKEDPSRAAKILEHLVISYQSAEASEKSNFALPV